MKLKECTTLKIKDLLITRINSFGLIFRRFSLYALKYAGRWLDFWEGFMRQQYHPTTEFDAIQCLFNLVSKRRRAERLTPSQGGSTMESVTYKETLRPCRVSVELAQAVKIGKRSLYSLNLTTSTQQIILSQFRCRLLFMVILFVVLFKMSLASTSFVTRYWGKRDHAFTT
jgi:hypothetical protein